MPELQTRQNEGDELAAVGVDNPLAVSLGGVVQVGASGDSEYVQIPGIGTAAAYADGDAFGLTVVFPNCLRPETRSGQLYSAAYLDLDKESLQVDLWLFKRPPTYVPTDNAAYAPTDNDLVNSGFLGVVSFVGFASGSTSSVANGTFLPIGCANAAGASIYGQAVTRGVQNIAINNLPMLRLVWLAD